MLFCAQFRLDSIRNFSFVSLLPFLDVRASHTPSLTLLLLVHFKFFRDSILSPSHRVSDSPSQLFKSLIQFTSQTVEEEKSKRYKCGRRVEEKLEREREKKPTANRSNIDLKYNLLSHSHSIRAAFVHNTFATFIHTLTLSLSQHSLTSLKSQDRSPSLQVSILEPTQ